MLLNRSYHKSYWNRTSKVRNFWSCQVGDLLGRYPDLMDDFNEFLARCEKNGTFTKQVFILLSLEIS
jgi:hypothetical protein